MRIGEERKAAEFNAGRSGQRQPEPGAAVRDERAMVGVHRQARGRSRADREGEPSDAGAGHLNPTGQHPAGTEKREPRSKPLLWKGD